MLKKLWYKAGTRFVIAYFFFLYTLYMVVKVVLMHFPGTEAETTDASYYGWIQSYYMAPVISAVMGYLFFKSGKRIQKGRREKEGKTS